MRELQQVLVSEFGLDPTDWILTEARGVSAADGRSSASAPVEVEARLGSRPPLSPGGARSRWVRSWRFFDAIACLSRCSFERCVNFGFPDEKVLGDGWAVVRSQRTGAVLNHLSGPKKQYLDTKIPVTGPIRFRARCALFRHSIGRLSGMHKLRARPTRLARKYWPRTPFA